jgi:hypothetical protein
MNTRIRWGVQHDWAERGEKPKWRTLGCGWIESSARLPSYVDFWPANYRTRREAREAVRMLTERAARHSKGWRFREIKLEIRTREVA